MSFFRSIRSSITRGKSSSRDTTPVRTTTSRPASVISIATTNTTNGRRDSTGSRTDSLLNRGDTFILGSEEDTSRNHSNTSTLEKKSKKSKVFSKFSTFTKRKKTPTPTQEEAATYEHHPSDTATNTYYKWKTDGNDRLLDYDAHSDPFNFLYEQHSSLKSVSGSSNNSKQDNSLSGIRRTSSIASSTNSNGGGTFDSSTYRKSKMPSQLREQLGQLKTSANVERDQIDEEHDEEDDNDDSRDKYKTVTLSSFRKSFRDKFLQQQKEAPHNPAWFVEVEEPAANNHGSVRSSSKENRPDFLVFGNDNYRPMSRSPLRERATTHRDTSTSRSPVKRNETFRVEQPNLSQRLRRAASPSPARPTASEIRIEIKNSIAPHMPSRVVPVGVAKPMPTTEYYAQRLLAANGGSTAATTIPKMGGVNLPAPGWRVGSPARNGTGRTSGRYQTLVQIGNEGNSNKTGSSFLTRGRAPTRVQLTSNGSSITNTSGAQKRFNSSGSVLNAPRYIYGSSVPTTTSTTYSSGYDNVVLLKPTKQSTYFGDQQQQQQHQLHNQRYDSPVRNLVNGNTPVNRPMRQAFSQSRSTPGSYSGSNVGIGIGTGGGGGVGGSSVYLNRQYQSPVVTTSAPAHRSSAMVSMQRRARSPIKMPWR